MDPTESRHQTPNVPPAENIAPDPPAEPKKDDRQEASEPSGATALATPLTHRKPDTVEGQNYLQMFDEQYQQITRKLDQYSMPMDSQLEEGSKHRKKGKGKKKKQISSDSEAGAMVRQVPERSPGKPVSREIERRQFTDRKSFQQAVTSAQAQGVTFIPVVSSLEDAITVKPPSNKAPKKALKKQAAELKQRQEVLTEFQRLGTLMETLKPTLESLQVLLDRLPPEQKHFQWLHPAYHNLHLQCVDLAHRAEVFLDDNPETEVVKKNPKIQVVITEQGLEAFYRSVVKIREFLFLYYAQNASCVSHKVLDGALRQFFPEARHWMKLVRPYPIKLPV